MRSDQSRRIIVPPPPLSFFNSFFVNLDFRAEKAVNEALENKPEPYLLALAQFATSADTEVVCKWFICVK